MWTLFASSAHATTKDVRGQDGMALSVHANSRILSTLTEDELGVLVLRGRLVNDQNHPLPKESLLLRLNSSASVSGVVSCDQKKLVSSIGEYAVETNETGSFCVRFFQSVNLMEVFVSYPGNAQQEAVETEVRRTKVSDKVLPDIRFGDEVRYVNLDLDHVTLTVALTIDQTMLDEAMGGVVSNQGLPLVLLDENGVILGKETTNGEGVASFTIETSKLGSPGEGHFEAKFSGTDLLSPMTGIATTLRSAGVKLVLSSTQQTLDEGDGLWIDVVRMKGNAPISKGTVDAMIHERTVFSSHVVKGNARIDLPFQGADVPVEVRLHYVSNSPEWRSTDDVSVSVVIRKAPLWKQVGLVVGVLVVSVMMTMRKRRIEKKPSVSFIDRPTKGRIQILSNQVLPSLGLSGCVVDLHEGIAVRALIELRNQGVLIAQAETNAQGEFSFADVPSGCLLCVFANGYQALEEKVQSRGSLRIEVISLRRAILAKFVSWADRYRDLGAPPQVPTPAEVMNSTKVSNKQDVLQWVAKVEHAAYSEEKVQENEAQTILCNPPG